MVRFRLIAPLLLLAQVALAQDAFDRRFRTAESLGSGDYKIVYAVEGNPNLALGVMKYDGTGNVLHEEKAQLDELEKAGVPVAKILEIGTYEGKAAYLMERFVAGTKSSEFINNRWKLLNERSIADLEKIKAALEKSKLEVKDLQFLIGADGRMVIADPFAVEHEAPSAGTKSSIDRLIAEAREAIRVRKLQVELARMPGAEDARLARWFRERAVDVPPPENGERSKRAQAELVEALLTYLESGETTTVARAVARAVRAGTMKVTFWNRWEGLEANELLVKLGGNFPVVAAELVREGAKHVFKTLEGVEREVAGAAHALGFLRAKGAPEGVGAEIYDRPSATEAELVRRLAANANDADRSKLEARARSILSRRVEATAHERAAPRIGIDRVLEERMRERTRDRIR